ncbi:ABC transporter permease [Brevibacterium sp. 50QC2O2]|uniref:ABC transporter permease n=1 Tax=Brevibacterium sp. 50QC2O2 TaxID=2968459 RepID=UPI00211CA14C|nr:ABC transporter permease [Brevibacterium sp. 50QC2O2]MCQ9389929.1 ABC transporter permease [Brevibacterium sp. 50QC2O2]
MRNALRLLPLLINARTLKSGPALLMMAAFAACSALFLTVAGGTWAFMHWDTANDAGGMLGMYKVLAAIATVLLIVPAFTLGQAAANLSSRRNDERLSSLSLLGASAAGVTLVALAEPALLATVGTVAGIAGYFVLLVPTSLIHFQGTGLGYANMVLPVWALVLAVVLLVAVSVASTLVGLRRVVVSPLGVRTRQKAPGFPWGRVACGAVLLVLVFVAVSITRMATSMAVIVVALLAMLAGGLLVVDLLGVVFVRIIARTSAKRARTAERLVAARFVLDDPKRYWRRVSGLAMTAFTATVAGTGAALVQGLNSQATAEAGGTGGAEASAQEAALQQQMDLLGNDIVTGILLVLGISFVFIAVSAVINQAADVYDRSDSFVQLHSAGMGVPTLRAITVRSVMLPVIWVSVFAAALGLVLVFPLAGAALVFQPVTFLVMVGSVAVGVLVVRVGLRLTSPLLARVAALG